MEKEKNKKKSSINVLNVLAHTFLWVGGVWILCGIVFWFILAVQLKGDFQALDSNQYSIFYYLSIVAVTIGLGLITISFSIRGIQNRRTDKSDDFKQNTKIVLKSFNEITSSNEALYVKEVLEGFSTEWDLDNIEESFVENPAEYLNKYFSHLKNHRKAQKQAKNSNSSNNQFVDSLLNYCKDADYYFHVKPTSDDEYLISFLKSCSKLLKQFEDICYEYCNDRVSKRLFEQEILPVVKKVLLRGYVVVNYYNLESELTYVRLSLLKEKNKANILLEEAEK